MKVLPTTLPGVVLLELDRFNDARGVFMETFHRDRYRDIGIDKEFVQDNYSYSAKGVLRGLHHQLYSPQGKLVHVAYGQIFDVAVDIRRGSATFGEWFGTLLSAENRRQLWIPPGFAHGFYVISDGAAVTYKVTQPYVPGDDREIRWNDSQIAIQWPFADDPILSAKDAAAATLQYAELPTV